MKKPAVLFDLDGTLTDSGEGIINCVQLALRHFGLPAEDRKALGAFVGPPLRLSFPRFGVPEDRVEEAVAIFRGRYNTLGKFENTPYPGISRMLARMGDLGWACYVATSKPEKTALEVLDHFDLTRYFVRVCGSTFDGSRDTKEQVLRYLLEHLEPGSKPILVGDTIFDVEGAALAGIPAAGVSWGYGDPAEMRRAGALTIQDTPEALLEWLKAWYAQ